MFEVPGTKSAPMDVIIEDTKLVAFLKLKGFSITAQICRDDPRDVRVGFTIQGDQDDIEKATALYYANEQVGITDYIRTLNEVKSQMYNIRKLRAGRS